MSERCDTCGAELRQCGSIGDDGEPTWDCEVCLLKDKLAAMTAAKNKAVGLAKRAWQEHEALLAVLKLRGLLPPYAQSELVDEVKAGIAELELENIS